jgi:hypothetical protein
MLKARMIIEYKVCKSAIKRCKKPYSPRLERNDQDRLMVGMEEQKYPSPQRYEDLESQQDNN